MPKKVCIRETEWKIMGAICRRIRTEKERYCAGYMYRHEFPAFGLAWACGTEDLVLGIDPSMGML